MLLLLWEEYQKHWEKLLEDLIPIADEETELCKTRKIEERNKIKACINMPDITKFGLTAWSYVNAVSDYMSHRTPIRETSSYYEGQLMRMIDSRNLVNVAHNSVRELVA